MRGETFREWETSQQLQSTSELEGTGEESGERDIFSTFYIKSL